MEVLYVATMEPPGRGGGGGSQGRGYAYVRTVHCMNP